MSRYADHMAEEARRAHYRSEAKARANRKRADAAASPAAGPSTVTSTIEFFDQPTPGFTWTICGWRGLATANAARRGKLRDRLALLKRDGETWRTLLAVGMAGATPSASALSGIAWADRFRSGYRLTVEEWQNWTRDKARDLGAVIESSKRGVDALVAAGWLPGDDQTYLLELVARPLRMAVGTPSPGVRLTVEALHP